MKPHPILRRVAKVLKGASVAGGAIAFLSPVKTSNELLILVTGLVIFVVCFGAGEFIEMELDTSKPPPDSKYDPGKPLGL